MLTPSLRSRRRCFAARRRHRRRAHPAAFLGCTLAPLIVGKRRLQNDDAASAAAKHSLQPSLFLFGVAFFSGVELVCSPFFVGFPEFLLVRASAVSSHVLLFLWQIIFKVFSELNCRFGVRRKTQRYSPECFFRSCSRIFPSYRNPKRSITEKTSPVLEIFSSVRYLSIDQATVSNFAREVSFSIHTFSIVLWL